ncbi:hypothetical protein K1X84_11975 [bacterium]|nr:hypothetical protein [bacterium]
MRLLLTLLIIILVIEAKPARAQAPKEGTPEFECLKIWSTGSEYWKNKEYANAIPFFKQAMECDKQLRPEKDKRIFTSVYEKLADCYVKLKHTDSAVAIYKLGYAETKDAQLIYKIGEMYHKQVLQFDSASVYYRQYYNLSGSVEELKRIAGMLVEAAKYKDALIIYDEYLEKNPKDQEIWVYVLDAFKSFYIKYFGKEQWLKQCQKYITALPDAPKDFFMAELLDDKLKQGQFDEVIKVAQEILAKDPKSKITWVKLAKAYDAKQQHKDALDAMLKAYALDEKDPDLICDIAQVYLDLNQFARTWEWAVKAKGIKKFGRPDYLIGEAISDGIKNCSGNVLDMPAKEAYLVAAKYYDMAAAFPDVEKNAKARSSFCRQNGPTKSDCFLGSLGKLKSASCYNWMPDHDYSSPCK